MPRSALRSDGTYSARNRKKRTITPNDAFHANRIPEHARWPHRLAMRADCVGFRWTPNSVKWSNIAPLEGGDVCHERESF
jgi:hypothetical protein